MRFSVCRFWLAALAVSLLTAGCASLSSDPSASIGTGARHMLTAYAGWDSPDFTFLDFRYFLNGKQIAGDSRSFAKKVESRGYSGPGEESTRVGDTVYVKWLHKPTGAVYENTIDLRGRLPAPVKTGGALYFVLAHETVHVYLAEPSPSPEQRPRFSYGCKALHAASKAHPSPDNSAQALYCARTVWKVYPEQKLINVPQENP